MKRIPGLYNEKGKFIVDIPTFPKYDFFNLTSLSRTQFLQEQFEVIENVLKEQFRVQNFDEFGLPTEDCIQIVGRIINYSNEDSGLKENDIGIINTGDNGSDVFKMRLNLQTVPKFTLFEGEIVVCQGF